MMRRRKLRSTRRPLPTQANSRARAALKNRRPSTIRTDMGRNRKPTGKGNSRVTKPTSRTPGSARGKASSTARNKLRSLGFNKGGMVKTTGKLDTGIAPCGHKGDKK